LSRRSDARRVARPRAAAREARVAAHVLTLAVPFAVPFAVSLAVALVSPLGARRAVAQDPTRRDSVRAPVRADSAARDTLRPVVLDTVPRRLGVFELLNLDRLRLISLGGSLGMAWPAEARGAQLYAIQTDYGEIARGVRAVFVASYWGTYYTDATVRGLERAVHGVVRDPSGDDTVRVGRVRLTNVSVGPEARWRPGLTKLLGGPRSVVRPWVGGGIAIHFLDAEGAAINGTFVESALDAVTAGVNLALGTDVFLLPNFLVTMQARYDLFSGARHPSVRAGVSYAFESAGAR
jgi:hypothetical protein